MNLRHRSRTAIVVALARSCAVSAGCGKSTSPVAGSGASGTAGTASALAGIAWDAAAAAQSTDSPARAPFGPCPLLGLPHGIPSGCAWDASTRSFTCGPDVPPNGLGETHTCPFPDAGGAPQFSYDSRATASVRLASHRTGTTTSGRWSEVDDTRERVESGLAELETARTWNGTLASAHADSVVPANGTRAVRRTPAVPRAAPSGREARTVHATRSPGSRYLRARGADHAGARPETRPGGSAMIRKVGETLAIALVAAVVLVSGIAHAAAHDHAVLQHWAIGGTGGWDDLTVDPSSHRLYVSRSQHMQVIDLETGKVAGDLPGTPGIHAIAIAPDLGRGFTSNGRDSSVTIFDTKSLAVVKLVPVTGRNPDAIVYEPRSHRVFAMNAGSGTATAIDARTGDVVGTVRLGGRPEFAVVDDHGRVYVNLEDSSAVTSFDAATLAPSGGRFALAPGEGPTGLAIDVAHRRLFAACGNRTLVVLDADRGSVLATLPTGEGTDGVAFDPGTSTAYVSNGDGTLTVVRERDANHFEVVANVPTQRGARTIALDRSTHRLYLPTARFGEALPPTAERPHPRPPVIPESFEILVVGTAK